MTEEGKDYEVDENGHQLLPPLVFSIPQKQQQQQQQQQQQHACAATESSMLKILVHQEAGNADEAQTDQHNVGFVMWPSAVMLARWITQNPSVVLDCVSNRDSDDGPTSCGGGDILELGAGCGLVGLTAATLLKQHQDEKKTQQEEEEEEGKEQQSSGSGVILTDYNPTVLENLDRNVRLNNLTQCTSVVGLDFFDQPSSSSSDSSNNDTGTSNQHNCWIDMEGTKHSKVGLILAADILCYSNDGDLVADTIQAALLGGGKAIVVTPGEDHRFGVQHFPEACRKVGLEVEAKRIVMLTNRNDDDGHGDDDEEDNQQDDDEVLLIHDLEQSGGYNQAYYNHLTMFTIDKPSVPTCG